MDQRAQVEITAELGAKESGKLVDPPPEPNPDLTAEDTYEIQLLQVRRWTAAVPPGR